MSALDDLRAFLAPEAWPAQRLQSAAERLCDLEEIAEAVLAEVDAGHLVDVRPLLGIVDWDGWDLHRDHQLGWIVFERTAGRRHTAGPWASTPAEAIRLAVEAQGGES